MSEARGDRGAGAKSRVGTVINGKWLIDARIGSGGMATVYAATHRNGHRAALKMLHLQLSRDPSTRARFLREGYVANAVGHPGVVAVLDDGVAEDGSAFLVLELLEGETVEARRERLGGTLSVEEVLEVADQALDALAAAHEKGIVHRDVKPENVFVTTDGQVKLLDFGLARMKSVEGETTKTGVTIGTPEFMPPEQARGRRDAVDARSDVWGLGATLFTLITGRYVHDDAQSLPEQLLAAATRRPKPIRQVAPHVPPAIAQVIDRALELEMDDRWPSARDMQLALRAARASVRRFDADSATIAASRPVAKPSSESGSITIDVAPTEETRHVGNAGSVAGEPARSFEDATDLEETFVEKGRAFASPRGGLRAEASRKPAVASDPSRPILEPEDGATLTSRPREPVARDPVDAPTQVKVVTDRVPRVPETVRLSPRPSLHAVSSEPPPSLPPPSFAPASVAPAYVPSSPDPFGGEPPPLSIPAPPMSSQPLVVPDPSEARVASSRRALLFLSLVLIVCCAAMAAYVLWRNDAAPP